MRFCGVVLICLLVGCSSGDPDYIATPGDFFPLKKGVWFIYAVDSVVIEQEVSTAYAYDLKIEITDSIPTPEGDYTYVLRRSKKPSSESSWVSLNTWSARVNAAYVATVEGNTAYISLEAPIQNGKTWNGNELNNLGGTENCPGTSVFTCDLYTIMNYSKPYSSTGLSFTSTLTVNQSDEDNLVYKDKRSEIYARAVGLVYREFVQLTYCNGCAGQQVVEQGVSYKQTLQSYGGL